MENFNSEQENRNQCGAAVDQRNEAILNRPRSLRSQNIRKVYVSRALSAFGTRIWTFSLGVFLNILYPDNLRVVAIYGFAVSVSSILCGPSLGRWIDQNGRWLAAKLCLLVENLSVILVYIFIILYYTLWTEMDVAR